MSFIVIFAHPGCHWQLTQHMLLPIQLRVRQMSFTLIFAHTWDATGSSRSMISFPCSCGCGVLVRLTLSDRQLNSSRSWVWLVIRACIRLHVQVEARVCVCTCVCY